MQLCACCAHRQINVWNAWFADCMCLAAPPTLSQRPVQPLVLLSICQDLCITRLLHVSIPRATHSHTPPPRQRTISQPTPPLARTVPPPAFSPIRTTQNDRPTHGAAPRLAKSPVPLIWPIIDRTNDGVHHEVAQTLRLIDYSRFDSAED